MEPSWTKKNLAALSAGRAETVWQWQRQYSRFIYTWLYFQVDKDEALAAMLTTQTLCQALRTLSAFEPDNDSMHLWLKTIAAEQLAASHAQSGLKTQRPWAWSQIPPHILESLKRLRIEPLSADVSECGAVAEMVQATLADISEQDRDLLVRRYNRLDTVDHIAMTTQTSSEHVNQRLYMARHTFRRGLFYLIQSANPDVNEPSGSGGLDLFEDNLETLLRSVSPSVAVPAEYAEQIKHQTLAVAAELARQRESANAVAAQKGNATKSLTIAVAVILIAIAAVWTIRGHRSDEPIAPPPTPPTPVVQDVPAPEDDAIDQDALKRVLELGAAQDIGGLLEVLRSGSYVTQMAAAYFLGQFGGESAIDPLLDAELRWHPNQPEDNPFFRAVVAIEQRLESREQPAPDIAETDADDAAPVTAATAALAGRILDFDGSPLARVRLSTPGVTVESDAEGRYRFSELPEGPFRVRITDAQQRIAETQRLVYPRQDIPIELTFGGQPSVAGRIHFDAAPLAEQVILLSDHFNDPETGCFTATSQTDAEGGFLFTGVPDGVYGIFARIVANRWTLLGQFDVSGTDMMVQVAPNTVGLNVSVEEVESPLRVAGAILRYSPESRDTLATWPGVRSEIDTVFRFNGVVPGVYTLLADLSNGVHLMRDIEVTAQPQQDILITAPEAGTAGLFGRFLSDWPDGLALSRIDPPLRVNVIAEADGRFVVSDLPTGGYTLGTLVNRVFVPFMEVGLYENEPIELDVDPARMARSRAPLYVTVTDDQGLVITGGQVWLSSEAGLFIAEPMGNCYFIAAPPGSYTLTAAFAGYSAYQRPILLRESDLTAPQNEANTEIIRLEP